MANRVDLAYSFSVMTGAANIATRSDVRAGPAKILVVEDEAIVALDLEQQLLEMGYEVCGSADNDADAIALARQHRPDLVLMDIVIKGDMDGVETARHIGHGLQIPVVFLTAYSDARTVERAASTAPHGYLTKPFEPKALRAAIEVALYKAVMEQRLRESEQWFASTLRCVGDGVIATDPQARVRFMNPQAELITGWGQEEALGTDVGEILVLRDPKTGAAIESPASRALREDAVVGIDYGTLLAAHDGATRPVDDSAAPIRAEDGKLLGAVVVLRDVSERMRAEQALRESQAHFRNAFDFAAAGMAVVALDGRFLQVNGAICALLGCIEAELMTLKQSELTHAGDRRMEQEYLSALLANTTPSVQFEKRYRGAGGKEIWALVSVSLLRAGDEPLYYLYQIYDLSERKEAEYQLARLAYFDVLTGLANRARLRDEGERMLSDAKRRKKCLGVVFLDLDRFKQVNDSLGHEAGDVMLQTVASRLKTCVRDTDCIGNLGGDEFVLLLSDLEEPINAISITEKVRRSLSSPCNIQGQEVPITSSLGVSFYPADGADLQKLFRCADSALYHAKAEGRNHTQFYRPELTLQVQTRLKLEAALHSALERDEFVLHYQPIVALASGKPVGAEALLRWRHPENGLMLPDDFILAAEETGLIVDLGEWVLQRAAHEAAAWQRSGAPLTVSVNVSVRQFKAAMLVDAVRRALHSARLAPELLCLEITEQFVLHDNEHNLAVLDELKSVGVRIALDDFGVGYSSLRYIKRFGPSSLKIDSSFVHGVADDPDDAAIVAAVIAMARRLRIDVVAEGVENEAQRAFLVREGCDYAQGFYFARPCAADAFRAWLGNKP
ncbi:MAG: EAL domain-containing protein [Burkholderiales bacterium]|nr:EAL domain-containing protein [Burkholderiales bacterium]